jgi:hypothetical protein
MIHDRLEEVGDLFLEDEKSMMDHSHLFGFLLDLLDYILDLRD